MRRKFKNASNLYSYLHSSGVLEAGDQKKIDLAREEYWKNYRKLWAKSKRKSSKSISISLNFKEYKIIMLGAKEHGITCTQYIRGSVLAYTQKTWIGLKNPAVNKIIELLSLTYTSIQNLEDDDLITTNLADTLTQLIQSQEKEITEALLNLHKQE